MGHIVPWIKKNRLTTPPKKQAEEKIREAIRGREKKTNPLAPHQHERR